MKIALFGNPYQEKYKASLNDFVSYLQETSDLMIEKDFRDYLESMGIDTDKARVLETGCFSGAELAVSIGGDGTLLSKAALLARQGIPVVVSTRDTWATLPHVDLMKPAK